MINTNSKSGGRSTRTKATFAASKKSNAAPEEDTPTVRQRIGEARKSGVLNLRGLNLPALPVAAENLSNLSALLLGQNRLTAVPNNLPTLFPNLTYLDLSWNKISSVPAALAELDGLELLDVEGNSELSSALPPTMRRLIDNDKLAVLTGTERITLKDVHDAGEGESEEESDTEEKTEPAAWRKDYYDTDDEADAEEGGYADEDSSNEDTGSGNDDDEDLHSNMAGLSVHAETLNDEFSLFMHRIIALESDALENGFRKRWRAGEPVFVRYIAKRYAADAGKATTRGVVGSRTKDRKQQLLAVGGGGAAAAGGGGGGGSTAGSNRSPSDAGSWNGTDDGTEDGADGEENAKPLKDRNRKRQVEYARKEKERAVKGDVKAGRKSKAQDQSI
ncbi:hypothetical protein HDU87_008820 [Geranomyces variabilis]|uniref:Uncharacterized protein n=1 Tax=Geranomyces variabilis TaxID=109894 RepID=A0AAD5TCR8_9FUNG|nr:hypothetical protein HDU87_008820 [Geranomyces variabilis]